MFSILAWSGCVTKSVELEASLSSISVELTALSRLGGCHVGSIWLSKPSPNNLVETIKDLQVQASVLLQHPHRTPNYMSVVLDGVVLPTLTYRDDMSQAQKDLALWTLHKATSKSRIELLWDEDDSKALKVLRDNHSCHFERDSKGFMCVGLWMRGEALPEVNVLKHCSQGRQVERIAIVYAQCPMPTPDLTFCVGLPCLTKLFLSQAMINSWDFLTKLGLTELTLNACFIQTTSMVESTTLKQLDLGDNSLDPKMLTRCTNLTEISLSDKSHNTYDEFRKVLPRVSIK